MNYKALILLLLEVLACSSREFYNKWWNKANITPIFSKVKIKELWASQPYLDPWEDEGGSNTGNHFQT